MANLSKGSGKSPKRRKQAKNTDGLVVGLGAGCIGFLVLFKLAIIAGSFYLAYLLVMWVLSK